MMSSRTPGTDRETSDPGGKASAARYGAELPTSALRRLATSFRGALHLKYLRAGVVGLATGVILLTGLACTLEVRHGVSYRAVLRFLSRDSFAHSDLSRLFRSPATAQRLANLFLAGQNGSPTGGFVHAVNGSLLFQTYRPAGVDAAIRDLKANQEIYPRLVASYIQHDLDALLSDLESATIRRRLEREGVSPLAVPRLKWRSRSAQGPHETLRLIREAGQLINHFFPFDQGGYDLSLGDKLRFYEESDPPGEFVGLFEIVRLRLGGPLHGEYAKGLAGRAHYLAVHRRDDGSIEIHDYYRGERVGVYRLSPLAHPADFPLFKVERVEPSARSGHGVT